MDYSFRLRFHVTVLWQILTDLKIADQEFDCIKAELVLRMQVSFRNSHAWMPIERLDLDDIHATLQQPSPEGPTEIMEGKILTLI